MGIVVWNIWSCSWMSYQIKVDQLNKRFGFIEGSVSHYDFYAEVSRENVPQGISLINMQKGDGKVIKLCIYRDETENEGDPFLPTITIKRHIYIDYDLDWKIYNFTFQHMVYELVQYLERRGQINIIR